MKSVTLSSGKTHLYPSKVYCYQSLKSSLQKFLLRPSFAKLCDHWHSLQRTTDVLHDIYDGNIWKDFQYINGSPALADQFVYAIMVNVDLFQPFKLTQTSVGAMYLTILNLPYHCRLSVRIQFY